MNLIKIIFISIFLIACTSKEVDLETQPAELVAFENTVNLKKIWSKSIGGSSEFLRLALRPTSDGSRIFAASHNGNIVALDALTGNEIWERKTNLSLSAGPGTDGKIVIVGSKDGDVVALDAKNGEQLWLKGVTSEVLAIPAVAAGKVFLRTVNGKLNALSVDSGNQLWTAQQSMPRLSLRGTSSPVVSRGLVISGFDNGRVAAFDTEDGNLIWEVVLQSPTGRTEIDRLVDINSDLQPAGGDLYAVGYQGRLGAIALESGQLIWSQELSSHSGLTVDSNNIYVSAQNSEIIALSRGSGRQIWRSEMLRNRDITAPVAFAGSIVVGDFEGYLHFFDPITGDIQSRIRADDARITSQQLVVNDLLYAMTDKGLLTAFGFLKFN
ncbi:MAG: outer membrane protein assembly factor BamB [Pseudomonadota bacterium]|nr:outer membrane protein assembly factor BamB [Pseudomonadota bacterium]